MTAPMRHRGLKVDDATWEAAQTVAAARGESVNAVIRRALVAYAAAPDDPAGEAERVLAQVGALVDRARGLA